MSRASGSVVAVAVRADHRFSKELRSEITLVAGVGVVGDAHAGATVQHRSRVAADPSQPNLRQVHLIQLELFQELRHAGFTVTPGAMGENITTTGVPLLSLPAGSLLKIGDDVVLGITGLRNPCRQIDGYQKGLLSAVVHRDDEGHLVRRAGVMAVVLVGGTVKPGDPIAGVPPPPPHRRLDRV